MVICCVLVILLLNAVCATAENGAGNQIGRSLSDMPVEPQTISGKSYQSNCGCISVLPFDDISVPSNTAYTTISSKYGGLTWSNGYILNTTWERVNYGWNGYQTGRNSGIFVAFNGGGSPMSISVPYGQYFQLNSMSLSSAWNDNLILTIKGTRCGVLYYQTTLYLQVSIRTALYTLKWYGIDAVTFNSTGGTPYAGLAGVGTHFVLDDLEISI